MTIRTRQIATLSAMLATSIAFSSMASVKGALPASPSLKFVPISAQEMKKETEIVLNNARVAGRINETDVKKLGERLNRAEELSDVEQIWADIEAKAQVARDRHASLDSMLSQFLSKLNNLQSKGIVPKEGGTFYRDRIAGIERIKKELNHEDNNFYSFWNFVVCAVDFSSVQDRLVRALCEGHPEIESLDQLVLRTDNYVAQNDVTARMLTTYKSFEVEPDNLQNAKNVFYTTLKDRAFSKMQTPEVHDQVVRHLKDLHYEASNQLPSEGDIDKAIIEVKRLMDSGADNGHLNAFDDVRIQHELELVKKVKQAYPGPNPGIGPIEKELRMEEVRFMSLDLRFLQDNLGRMLRHDGESGEGREQMLRAMRRMDLAHFSHRITDEDVKSLTNDITYAIKHAINDKDLAERGRGIEMKMDMMISDFSMTPARTEARYKYVSQLVSQLKGQRDAVSPELDRLGRLTDTVNHMQEGPQKYGASIVASAELEIFRKRVQELLQAQGV
ncbi:MAG TPA: hypothetical protein V6D22_26345 [Candidatus Obscuribacterales bacterium]